MAGGGFPARKPSTTSNVAQPGGGAAGQLDAPPPSPMMAQAGGQQPSPSMPMPMPSEISRPMTAGSPGRVTSPEILMGIMQSMETISGMYDSMALILPDLATDFALLQDLGQRTMAKLLIKGGQPASPAGAGMNFPGGGFARGA